LSNESSASRFWRFVSNLLILGLIVFSIALATPVLGVYVAFEWSAQLGCALPNWGSACAEHGYLLDKLAIYDAIPIANLVGTPLIFAYAFWDVVLAWVALIVVIKALLPGRPVRTDDKLS